MNFKCKINSDDITYGPKMDRELNDVEAFLVAGELMKKGYRKVSNAYCMVARIDRPDWLCILAESMNTCVANFYRKNGTGVPDEWRDHYVRVFSKDQHTVHPAVLRKMRNY